MLYLPPLRRLLLPSLLCLSFLIIWRSSHRFSSSYLSSLVIEQPIIALPQQRVAVSDLSTVAVVVQDAHGAHIEPSTKLYYEYGEESRILGDEADPSLYNNSDASAGPRYMNPAENRYLRPLLDCPIRPNRFTHHIRLPNKIRPISMVLSGNSENEKRSFLNAAILSLPYWSENQYLLVSRVQTDGSLQLNIVCEANICYTDPANARPGERPCGPDDLELLGGAEGMRCATPPLTLNVPPTPAKSCGDGTGILMDVPGFHDPRIFWSGKGEPLMILNTQSRYACFGLWAIDLRLLHYPLQSLLSDDPKFPTMGPLMSYPYLTEITRNPPWSRGIIEKNWMFFSTPKSSYVHYDIGPSVRSFAKLLGGGLTTPNLTDPLEQPCLREGAPSKEGENWGGSWHQGTNSLRLILCDRSDLSCRLRPENTVFWSLIHHKHKNMYQLPLRYERYFIIWSSTPPFSMLAMSSRPILLANETAGGWDPGDNWDDDAENQQLLSDSKTPKENFAVFSYTVSIAYSWGRFEDRPQDKNTGYLDDEVIVGLGVDDEAQGYARATVQDLLQCLRICPPRALRPLDGSGDPGWKGNQPEANAFSEDKFGGDEDVDEDKRGFNADELRKKAEEEAAAAAKIAADEAAPEGAAMVGEIPESLRAAYAATGELPVAYHEKDPPRPIWGSVEKNDDATSDKSSPGVDGKAPEGTADDDTVSGRVQLTAAEGDDVRSLGAGAVAAGGEAPSVKDASKKAAGNAAAGADVPHARMA